MKVSPEFLPIVEWWEKGGKKITLIAVVVIAAVGGGFLYVHNKKKLDAQAASVLDNAGANVYQLEEAVGKYGNTKPAGVLKLRLAKEYFDAEKYELALEQYESLIADTPDGFDGIPEYGKAHCLEAMEKYAEAAKVFDELVNKNPDGYLALSARIGSARAVACGGDRKTALERLEELKKSVKAEGDVALVESAIDFVKRFEKRDKVDFMADATVAPVMPAVEKPAAKPVVKPADKPAAKPAVKPAAKPATKPAAKPAAKPSK